MPILCFDSHDLIVAHNRSHTLISGGNDKSRVQIIYMGKEKEKMAKVGDKIRVIYMDGEPNYSGREGIVKSIDSMGQLHGSWGGLAIIPGEDEYEIITDNNNG